MCNYRLLSTENKSDLHYGLSLLLEKNYSNFWGIKEDFVSLWLPILRISEVHQVARSQNLATIAFLCGYSVGLNCVYVLAKDQWQMPLSSS